MASATSLGLPNLCEGICAVSSAFRASEKPVVESRESGVVNELGELKVTHPQSSACRCIPAVWRLHV